MEEKYLLYQDKKIFYRTTGKGKTVMLLHGFAEDGEIWHKQIEALENNFHLIIPDIPGSGKSDFIKDATIKTYAEIIKEIINTEALKASPQPCWEGGLEGAGGGSVSLIGHSMGGYITLSFAEKYPQYLNSFGLFHSTAFADSEEKKQVRTKAIDFIKENKAYQFIKTSTPGLFAAAFTKNNPSSIEALGESGKNFSEEALIQYYNAMMTRPDRVAVLKNFAQPILFIIGQYDTAIPLQNSLEQCWLPAISHVHILAQSAHMGMWEEAEKANEILINFLSPE